MAGGAILGIRNYFFLDQPDKDFTLSADTVLRYQWDVPLVKTRLKQIMTTEKYDYIFCLLPIADTHGGHKAATIMALESVKDLPPAQRPIVLGESDSAKNQPATFRFTELPGYPVTTVKSGASSFHFDKTQKFGYHDALDYKIVVNWMIAEHKSQGTMQLYMNAGDYENFWLFDANDPSAATRAAKLFEQLEVLHYKKKTY
jgi:hypothetical protein